MLNKQALNINFALGLDTKTDPWQVSPGKFLALDNTVFTKGGLLQKRNGFEDLSPLPDTTYAYTTTLNDNLTAIGPTIAAYNESNSTWVSKGTITPMEVSTLPLIRNNLNQTQCDAAVATNGLVCTTYSELNNATTTYKYVISDSITGQNIIAPTLIPPGTGTVIGSPRVFLMGSFFVIVFTNDISGAYHLQYIAISTSSPLSVTAAQDIASAYIPKTTLSWDGVVVNQALFIAYNNTTGGQNISVTYINSISIANNSVATPLVFNGAICTMMSMCADITIAISPYIYISYYDAAGSTGYTACIDANLNVVHAPSEIISSGTILNLASAAQNGVVTVFEEVAHNYSYDSGIPSHFVQAVTVTQAGVVGSTYVVIRSVGLASKAFIVNGQIYFLGAYQSTYQPTYFLVNSSTSIAAAPVIVAKLAYENGGGYDTVGLPSVTVQGTTAYLGYLFKDLIEALNTLNNTTQTTAGGIYSQTGINLATFDFTDDGIDTVELGGSLQLSGGFGGMYDGYLPVEENFFLWPDSIEVAASATSGSMSAQVYYYQVVYEWSDNNGNIYRSAPSIPAHLDLSVSGDDSITVTGPYLRLTMKTANPLKVVIYRWSAAQQIYYQVTSITAPILNSTTADSWSFTDTLSDASIAGNNIIYTNGGVLEDVNSPASNIMTIFDTRAWKVDAEDKNLLWFSKQVIEATPVEWSDLQTLYVAPNIGTVSSSGPITGLIPCDDKLIIAKANCLYFINGSGPDSTGANNQYQGPFFITSTVGCSNQQSMVYMNSGIMMQTDKGIWLLDRGSLQVSYIGAPVEKYNNSTVVSAINVPEVTEVRFTLNTGETLVYNYLYQQWSVFTGIPGTSSCVYHNLQTYINQYGQVRQESPGSYIDGDTPTLIDFTTGWINMAGIQGYERLYDITLLGQYISPHYLVVQIAYDYGPFTQQSIIMPNNYTGPYGSDPTFGTTPLFGGPGSLEQWRIHTQRQTCQSFQVRVQELYNPAFGTAAGAGFTLSGMACRIGIKKGVRPIRPVNSVG